jgi:hypothetical protein
MTRAPFVARATLLLLAAIGLAGCVRVEDVHLPADAGSHGTPVIFRGAADTVCVYEPHPPALGPQVGLSDLKGLRTLIAKRCPDWHGQGLAGRWAPSFETLVFQVRDCRVVATQRVFAGERMIDAVQGDFCTKTADVDIAPVGSPPTPAFIDKAQVQADVE